MEDQTKPTTETVTVFPEVTGLANVALQRLLEGRKKRKLYMRKYRLEKKKVKK